MQKMIYLLSLISLFFFCPKGIIAQNNQYWDLALNELSKENSQLMLGKYPNTYVIGKLNIQLMLKDISLKSGTKPITISIPTPDRKFIEFDITETTVVSKEVADLYTIKTFKGHSKHSPKVTIRCDISPAGFHAVVFVGNASFVIEPIYKEDVSAHIVYYKSDLEVPGVKCGVNASHRKGHVAPSSSEGYVKTPANLRTYRLAIIADNTFRNQFGGMPYDVTNVLNAMAAGVNLNNEIYERDLGVTFMLVSNSACVNAVLANHTNINSVHSFLVNSSGLELDGFDVGHSLLWSNTGGAAYLGVVCNNNFKGGGFSGVTGSFTQLFVDYVAHELGHQFGANHTFVSQECGTSEPNFRYETGEGSTIMAYAGVCGPNPSYQNFSDPYFHAASIDEMNTYLDAFGGCASISTPGTGNSTAPVVNAQSDIIIPRQTPFILVGSATDDNSDPISFTWQQYNGSGNAVSGQPNCNSTTHPLFRFRTPVSDNFRVFPQMSDVLNGNNNTSVWEKLPCVARTMNFRLTGRDNNPNWGRTHADDMIVTVADTGPFNVTAPNGGESLIGNSQQNVTWTVNGTDAHCTDVDILISTDNGSTYSILGTFPNNGSAIISIPNTPSTSARVLIQCSVGGNFRSASTFFDVSDAVFTIMAVPENDLCINATPIVANGGNICGTTINAGADNPNGGADCGFGADAQGDGVWYTFAGDGREWEFYFPAMSGWDPEVNAYAGTCSALICVGGDDDSGSGLDASFSLNTVVDTMYYIYVHSAFTTETSNFCFTATTCPTFSAAPGNVTIVNSTCGNGCTLTGGNFIAPEGMPCPAGSTLQYQVDSGSWSATVPAYNQSGPAQTIRTRCMCDADNNIVSVESNPVNTVPSTLENPVVPSNGSATVDCPALATQPAPPVVMACDGSTITPTGPIVTNNPDPLSCEGIRTYTWTYSCGETSSNWSFVYTIERNPFTVPANGTATVNSPAAATQPVPPIVLSNCGETLTPTGPVVTNSPNPVECTGTRTYTWTYIDCEGNTATWSFVYTIIDDEPPMITCFNQTININGEISIPLNPDDLIVADDNCGIQNISLSPNSITSSQFGQTVPVVVTVTDVNGNSATCTSQITVSGLPAGWSQNPNGVGCADGNNIDYNASNATWTATSTNCFYSSPFISDAAAFAQYTLCGNGSITAQVTGISGTSLGWAGVVMRETNTPGAKKAQLTTNMSNFSRREFRSTINGAAFPQQFFSPNRHWLRLVRSGNQFVMYISQNGVNWLFAGAQNIQMNSCIEIGLVVTNYNSNSTVTATFANVSVTGGNQPLSDGGPESLAYQDKQPDFRDIKVYPNPTSGQLNIALTGYEGRPVTLEVFNTMGQILYIKEIDEVQNGDEIIDLSAVASSMYLIRVSSDGLPAEIKRVTVAR